MQCFALVKTRYLINNFSQNLVEFVVIVKNFLNITTL